MHQNISKDHFAGWTAPVVQEVDLQQELGGGRAIWGGEGVQGRGSCIGEMVE